MTTSTLTNTRAPLEERNQALRKQAGMPPGRPDRTRRELSIENRGLAPPATAPATEAKPEPPVAPKEPKAVEDMDPLEFEALCKKTEAKAQADLLRAERRRDRARALHEAENRPGRAQFEADMALAKVHFDKQRREADLEADVREGRCALGLNPNVMLDKLTKSEIRAALAAVGKSDPDDPGDEPGVTPAGGNDTPADEEPPGGRRRPRPDGWQEQADAARAEYEAMRAGPERSAYWRKNRAAIMRGRSKTRKGK